MIARSKFYATYDSEQRDVNVFLDSVKKKKKKKIRTLHSRLKFIIRHANIRKRETDNDVSFLGLYRRLCYSNL